MAEAVEYLKLDMEDLIELCGDKEFRHTLNGWVIAYQLRNQIRLMRLRKGWSQKELGRRAGFDQPTVSKLENMTPARFPSIRTLRRIANVFDVSLLVSVHRPSEGKDRE